MFRSIAVAALIFSGAARAQTYVASVQDGVPYPQLTAATPVTLVAASGTPGDRGRASVPLGFTFPFYDRLYSQLTVTANGVLFLEPSTALNQTSDFLSNLLGSVAEPNGVIAPFWDDLDGNNATSGVQTQAITGANGQGLAVEFKDWNRKFGTYVLNFQVRLWANGMVEFFYGTMTGSGSTVSASCGLEAPGTGLPVHCPCASNNNCQLVDLPTGRRITFGPAAGADLLARALRVDAIVPSGGNLTVTSTLALRNFGTVAASNFTYRLYASDDTFYSPGTDAELTPGPQGPYSLNPLAELTSQVTTTVAAPAGAFYLLAVIDDGNLIAESNELNNLVATATPFSPGIDLVAQQILGPPLGGPGESITNTLVFSNQGVDPPGNVGVKIWLSLDNVLGAGDHNVYAGTLAVAGGQNVYTTVNYNLPGNVPAGDYVFILQLDDGPAAGAIAESSDANNVVVGTQAFTARQADLLVEAITVRQPLPPYLPAPQAFFGEPIRVQITVKNQGGATAPVVSVLAFLSDNDTLNAVTDTFIGEVSGLSLGPGQSMVVNLDQPMPINGSTGQPLATAQYFFFGAAVGQGLVEASGTNNYLKTAPLKVRQPAPDLTPLLANAPPVVGQGERVVVTRTLANLGNRPAPQVAYRYYLSANAIITPDDLPLKLVDAGGNLVPSGQVTLGVGERSVQTEILEIPGGAGLTHWYLGVLMDPENLLDETDEANNGFASQQVQVIGRGLTVSTSTLPDGLLDGAYDVTLGASGGDGSYAWSTGPGTALPQGLAVTRSGHLSGTPTEAGAFSVNLAVESAGLRAERLLVLRVGPLTGSLAVATAQVPPAPRLGQWETFLSAAGGRAPYRWSLVGGGLPAGLSLDSTGRLWGVATAPIGSSTSARFRVVDAVGNFAERALDLAVIDPAAIRIAAAELPLAMVGSDYTVDLLANAPSGSALVKPLTWKLLGQPPPGLVLQPSVDERLLLVGVPTEVGAYLFALEVQDATGRSDSRELLVYVVPSELALEVELPPALAPGEAVVGKVSASAELAGAVFRVRDGLVPKGLVLSSDGALSGTLAPKGELLEGTYVFTVAYRQGNTDVAFTPVAVNVNLAAARALKGCGCDLTGGAQAWALLVGLLAWARSKQRA